MPFNEALADNRQFVLRYATGVVLAIAFAIAAHSDCKLFRKGVDAGNTHAVQTA